MNVFSHLLASNSSSNLNGTQQKSFVTYSMSSLSTIKDTPSVTLLEARNILAGSGTTGLRTWEAALHLGSYLCANKELIFGKSVLELGCGTGFVSILCTKHLGATQVLMTDGSSEVISDASANLKLNGLDGSHGIHALLLLWEEERLQSPPWTGQQPPEIVIGADITYDETIIPALVGTFKYIFELLPHVEIIISATIRNSQTIQAFEQALLNRKMSLRELDFDLLPMHEQMGPFYPDNVPIRLYMITKSNLNTSTNISEAS